MSECRVIPFQQEYLEKILEIEKECFPPLEQFDCSVFYWYLSLNPFFYLAECRSEIAGYILGVLENDGSCHIVSIAVKEKWRRRRIGSLLLNTLLEECRKHGAWRAILEVAVDNKPAVNLYLKHGFIVKKIIPRYYSSGRDAFFMEKKL